MRAALFRHGRFEIGNVPEPPAPRSGQLLIEVQACGICEGDLNATEHTAEFLESSSASGIGTYDFDPEQGIVMGHEFSGRVIEVATGVSSVALGDLVAGYATVFDEVGVAHVAGYSNRYPGGFGQRMLVQEEQVQRVPDGLAADAATLAEPLSVGEKAVQRSNVKRGDAAIVSGAGPVGLGTIAALIARGIEPVIAVETAPQRARLAEKLGAVVVSEHSEATSIWRSRFGGASQVIAFETSGERGMINRLLYSLPKGARIMVAASGVVDDVIRPFVAVYKSIVINFQFGETKDAYPITIGRVASGTFDTAAMITGRVSLSGLDDAFRKLAEPNDHIRILVEPNSKSGDGAAA